MKQQLGQLDKVISTDVDSKMWSYMETRAALLLKAYETSIEVKQSFNAFVLYFARPQFSLNA